jgi:hypothetical protein
MLVDVRFKLLALVPTASLLSLATVIGNAEPSKFIVPQFRSLFPVLGLMATLGLLLYDLRNSELHDDLISRGRKIEDEFGRHRRLSRKEECKRTYQARQRNRADLRGCHSCLDCRNMEISDALVIKKGLP